MANFWKFCEYLSLRMASFWKFWLYKFQPQGKRNKKKTVESRDFRLMFCQDQRKDRQVTMEKLLLLIDSKKSWIDQKCLYICFCEFIFAKYEFSAYLACIYFRECLLKENFACIWFCEINQTSRNSRKYVHAKISTFKADKNRILHFQLPSLHFKRLVFQTAFAIYFIGYFPDPKF